jgi:osmotically-inducible protein OsmY
MDRDGKSGQTNSEARQPDSGMSMGESPIMDQTVLAPQTDGELEHAIRDAFFLHPDLPSDPFEIRVEDGIAYIGGTNVDSHLRQRAINVAENVQRIKKVIPVFDGD